MKPRLFCCLILLHCFIHHVFGHVLYKNQIRHEEYDYIIVGAGASGSVLANRLSEDGNVNVLLLEAGRAPSGTGDIPLLSTLLLNGDMDWGYVTEPQKNAALGFIEQRVPIPRGKALGGSTILNSMMYVRGNPRDYDEWAKGGATGWSWKDVFHYFLKSEDQQEPELLTKGFHQKGGYLTVSTPKYSSPLKDDLLNAGRRLGHNIIDSNEEEQLGFSPMQMTVRNGLRCSTEKAFLRPAASRENLDILTHAHVTKVLFDDDKRARSVRFEHRKASHVISARKEIILSAGAIGTPQILMLSGIGPKEHLQELGIPVVADLPVGLNFQDHIAVAGLTYTLNSSQPIFPSPYLTPQNVEELLEGRGPLSVAVGSEAMAYINTKFQDPSENWPDVQVFFLSRIYLPPVEDFEELQSKYGEMEGITLYPTLCRPKGRGFVRLRSTDPFQHPIVEPQYFEEEDDLNRIVEALKFLQDVMATPHLQKYKPKRVISKIPGCENMDEETDEFLRCTARSLTATCYHQSGTCKMGAPDDPTTVVDPQLRVKGVHGLRVVDASIMPLVISGNTNAPCIMIGEKAADMIRGRFWDPRTQKIVTF